MAIWRPLASDDIAAVSKIAAAVHPGFFEEDAVFADRVALAPQGCWLLEADEGPLGYVLSHPWRLGDIPALNTTLGSLPVPADTFYIHDLALLRDARGTGAAGRIVETLIATAVPCPTMSLVAVNGSLPFWSRFGFAPVDAPELAGKLESYDGAARYMVRQSAPLAKASSRV